MYAIIKFHDVYAMIRNMEWETDESWFKKLLDSMKVEGGPSGADPQPDVTEAYRVAKIIGAKVVEEEFDKHELGRIY